MMKRIFDNIFKFNIKVIINDFIRVYSSNSNNKVENNFNGPTYFIGNLPEKLISKSQ